MSFTRKLLAWYKRNARVLPWRETRNPTMASLAAARPKAVMEEWDGLGYYARARNLHKLAKQVAETGDRIPDDPEDLRTLPGVGRYTAGAVACFAYEKPVATVDTNVRRVLERAFGSKDVWELAEQLVPKKGERAWRFNQALMELGALVCKPRSPLCPECPIKDNCRTFTTRPQTHRGRRS